MMTFKDLQFACSLCSCKLTENEESLNMEFPEVTVNVKKSFNQGLAEASLIVAYGWMKVMREYLDNQKEGKEVSES